EIFVLRCNIRISTAHFDNAEKHLSEAVRLGKDVGESSLTAFGLAHKANTLTYMTRFDAAWQTAQEGLQVAEESGTLDFKADILSFPVPFHYMCEGDLDAAYRAAEESYQIASKIGVARTICI